VEAGREREAGLGRSLRAVLDDVRPSDRAVARSLFERGPIEEDRLALLLAAVTSAFPDDVCGWCSHPTDGASTTRLVGPVTSTDEAWALTALRAAARGLDRPPGEGAANAIAVRVGSTGAVAIALRTRPLGPPDHDLLAALVSLAGG